MDRYVHDAVLDMHMARTELLAALEQVRPPDWQRCVPYGSGTVHDLLAHLAAADHAWALAAQGLLKGEAEVRPPLSPGEAKAARQRAVDRGRLQPTAALLEEMGRRRKLLLSLYELLEPRHLALALRSFGDQHNSVRERIWLGYHDRLHVADVRRALRMSWHPQRWQFLPVLQPAVDALSPDEALYVVHNVDPVCWEQPSIVPSWTYRQLLAHIATGDWVLQGHVRYVIERGEVAAWPDIDAGNADLLASRAHSTERALTEEYLSMRHETMLLLSRLRPEQLSLRISFWWEPQPNEHSLLDYVLAFEHHDRTHREQLRPAMRYARAMGAA
jgi:hypothetical protein